jgi:DNA-binding CsgD family transcriptional regulator
MGSSSTIQQIRHIAALGLPSRMAIAAMVDLLGEFIPTRTTVFSWTGPGGVPCDLYEREPIPAALDAMLANAPALAADPFAPSFDKIARSTAEFGGWRQFLNFPGWEKSIMLNELFRPYNIGNNLDFPLRENGVPKAVLVLAREPGTHRLTRKEIELVLSLRPHFLHAMASDALAAHSRSESWSSPDAPAMVMVHDDGSVTPTNERAAMYLQQLSHLGNSPIRWETRQAPAPIREAVARQARSAEGANALPPSLEANTEWGRFRVTAHPPMANGAYPVSVEKRVALRLALVERAARMDLSPRERELAVHLCSTLGGEAIAARMGISLASYREYARRTYERLGVDGRLGVISLLVGLNSMPAN